MPESHRNDLGSARSARMTLSVLPAAARQPEVWRNGGGLTYEIARCEHPLRTGEFLWRVSIAEVSVAGPFSRFAGYERLIAVIDGAGMTLRRGSAPAQGRGDPDGAGDGARVDYGDETQLSPFAVLRFDGAERVAGELPQGAVKDFNVIFDPSQCRAALTFHDGAGERRIAHREVVVVNVSGAAVRWDCSAGSGELRQYDALRLAGYDERLDWKGPGRLALVEIDY